LLGLEEDGRHHFDEPLALYQRRVGLWVTHWTVRPETHGSAYRTRTSRIEMRPGDFVRGVALPCALRKYCRRLAVSPRAVNPGGAAIVVVLVTTVVPTEVVNIVENAIAIPVSVLV